MRYEEYGEFTNHLNGDMEYSAYVELATALLEQVFQALAEQIHYHHVVSLSIGRLFISDVVEGGNVCFSPKLVDQF
jgi:hypothetical protein